MIKIKHRDLNQLVKWHFQEFKKFFLPILIKKRNRLKRKDDKRFINYLVNKLEVLVTGKPYELEKIIEASHRYNPNYYREWNYKKKSSKRTQTSLYNLLQKVFDYDKFCSNRNDDWNAYRLAEKLNVRTCPYCNRQYTHTVIDEHQSTEEKRRIVRPDFDHFFDKATYPFLALSFYNLIPSCNICNSRLKGSTPFSTRTHIHPYIEGFGNYARFKLFLHSSRFFHGDLNSGEIIIQLSNTQSGQTLKKIKNNVDAFELERLYQEHKDYVFELVNRSLIYNEDYLDVLFNKYRGTLFRNREDLLRLIHGNYFEEDFLQNRPLAKLSSDIQRQFEL